MMPTKGILTDAHIVGERFEEAFVWINTAVRDSRHREACEEGVNCRIKTTVRDRQHYSKRHREVCEEEVNCRCGVRGLPWTSFHGGTRENMIADIVQEVNRAVLSQPESLHLLECGVFDCVTFPRHCIL